MESATAPVTVGLVDPGPGPRSGTGAGDGMGGCCGGTVGGVSRLRLRVQVEAGDVGI